MALSSWSDYRFQEQVNAAIVHVRRILDNNKNPLIAGKHRHCYDDKYDVSELVTNASIASHLTFLSNLGADEEKMQTLVEWARSRSITLRLRSEEKCKFIKEVKRKYDSENKLVVESSFGNWTAKVSHTVTEYKWRFDVSYEIVAFHGTGESAEDMMLLQMRSGRHDFFTKTDQSVRPAVSQKPNIDVDITWLFRQLGGHDDEKGSTSENSLCPSFNIDRSSPKCLTPRRNPGTEDAIAFISRLHSWCARLHRYFVHEVFPIQEEYQRAHSVDLDTSSINADELFVPILPIFIEETPDAGGHGGADLPVIAHAEVEDDCCGDEEKTNYLPSGAALIGEESSPSSLTVTAAKVTYLPDMHVVNALLREEQRVLQEKFAAMTSTFPPASTADTLITAAEAHLLVSLLHAQQISQQYVDAVDYIEDLLRQQLVAAIGKVVQPSDFATYMRFHNSKLFVPQYQPKPFCYAVRRSDDHAPEGVLCIEERLVDGSIVEPVLTLVSRTAVVPASCMSFTLNAATSVSFSGDMYMHAYMRHAFHQDTSQTPSLSLRAEARQFSSFIVLLGRISSATSFDPKYAMIVQNKDDVTIPLDLETIPSAKEFKDAISSLSPEQQRFATAFRGMQLESTLFGVLIIQIKPQLEKVLNLPPDSLTKEIQLTQHLMELFTTYQIPSDLLSYAGDSAASVHEKLEQVRGHVEAIRNMISSSKEKELKEKREKSMASSYQVDDFFGGVDDELLHMNSDVSLNERRDNTHNFKKKNKGGGISLFSGRRSKGAPQVKRVMDAAPAPLPRRSALPDSAMSKSSKSATSEAPATASRGEASSQPANAPPASAPHAAGHYREESANDDLSDVLDCTMVPQELDGKFEAIDKEGSVRPTIINPGSVWNKRFQKALLDEPHTLSIDTDEQKKEKTRTFDLIDALTKSGGLVLEHTEMHVVIAATHCFDKNVMDTIVQNNVNPIEKVEMSTLIMAATIHREPVRYLVREEHLARVLEFSPCLLQIADEEA